MSEYITSPSDDYLSVNDLQWCNYDTTRRMKEKYNDSVNQFHQGIASLKEAQNNEYDELLNGINTLSNRLNNLDKSSVGLSKVDNTPDTYKPVSIFQKKAIDESLNQIKNWVSSEGYRGKSAYEIAVEYGYEGTEEEWASRFNQVLDSCMSSEDWNQRFDEIYQKVNGAAATDTPGVIQVGYGLDISEYGVLSVKNASEYWEDVTDNSTYVTQHAEGVYVRINKPLGLMSIDIDYTITLETPSDVNNKYDLTEIRILTMADNVVETYSEYGVSLAPQSPNVFNTTTGNISIVKRFSSHSNSNNHRIFRGVSACCVRLNPEGKSTTWPNSTSSSFNASGVFHVKFLV